MILELPQWMVGVMAGLAGLAVGSFLNVCSLRWPRDESVVAPPSSCPECGAGIRWYDNVPVLSWLLLRGRCRSCGAGISVQYPLVELFTGLIWAGLFLHHGLTWEALRGSVFLTILFGIAISDARFYIIPDQFSIGGAVVGLVFALAPAGLGLRDAAIGAAVGFGILWLVAVLGKLAFRKEAMGGGDIKMMAMIGAFVGPVGVLLTLFLGAVFGALIFGPISMKTKKLVPFGIFLAAGAAVTYTWGDSIVSWYLREIVGIAG